MPDPSLSDLIARLPKAELHVHIEGTLEPELKFALAQRNGIDLEHTTVDEVRASYTFDSLASFLTVYYDSMRVLVTPDDFYELAMAYLTTAAAQNVRHTEIFFDPQAHTSRGVPFSTVIGGLRRAVVDARRELGIHAELILCFLRDFTAEHAMSTLMESLPYKDWILGVGLDSDERGNPPSKFTAAFARARQEGYLLTMHCDIDQENIHEHIRQVIEDIGVDRIDHGSNALSEPALVAAILDRGLGLTCCPVSNQWVTDSMKSEQIIGLLDAGVKLCVNSDDPAYFGAYLNENLERLAVDAGLSRDQVIQLARNSFEISWLPENLRATYLAELDEIAQTG